MTSESTTIERITNSIFRKINYEKAQERVLLICPMCRAELEALPLHKDQEGYQTVWWVCKNSVDGKCSFPADIPPEVFWVKRSPEDIELGIYPRPNLKNLPTNFRHLYPSLFPDIDLPAEIIPSTPDSALSDADIDGVDNTRNASLASELGSIDRRMASTAAGSVVAVDSVTVDQLSGGSNSYSTGTTGSVIGPALGVVPCSAEIPRESRKRPASSPLKLSRNPRFNQALAEHFQKLKEQGVENIHLRVIAEKLLEIEESLPEGTANNKRIPLISQDEYTDTLLQNLPVVTRFQATEAVKKHSLTQKLQLATSVRTAQSGTGLLKMMGLQSAPLPESNKWRMETREQVSATLRKAAKETQKVLAKKRIKAVPQVQPLLSSSPRWESLPSLPSTSADTQKNKQMVQEAELKTKALVQSKIRSRLEEQKSCLERQLDQIPVYRDIKPMPYAFEDVVAPPTRERLDSFGFDDLDFVSAQFPELGPSRQTDDEDGLDDLFAHHF